MALANPNERLPEGLQNSIVKGMSNSPDNVIGAFVYLAPSGLLRYSEAFLGGKEFRYDFTGLEERAATSMRSYMDRQGINYTDLNIRLRRGVKMVDRDGTDYLVVTLEEY